MIPEEEVLGTVLEFHLTIAEAQFIARLLGNMNSEQLKQVWIMGPENIGGQVWMKFSEHYPHFYTNKEKQA